MKDNISRSIYSSRFTTPYPIPLNTQTTTHKNAFSNSRFKFPFINKYVCQTIKNFQIWMNLRRISYLLETLQNKYVCQTSMYVKGGMRWAIHQVSCHRYRFTPKLLTGLTHHVSNFCHQCIVYPLNHSILLRPTYTWAISHNITPRAHLEKLLLNKPILYHGLPKFQSLKTLITSSLDHP